MRVTFKNLFVRRVTLHYPTEKQPMKKNFRGMVDLIPEVCVICYQCIKICPVAALDLRHKQTIGEDKKKKLEITKFTFNGELCCFCGLCEEVCPTDAIFLNKMYETSAFTHEEILDINLMDVNKYKALKPDYDFALEAKKKEKAAPVPVPAPTQIQAPTQAPAQPQEQNPEKPTTDNTKDNTNKT